MLGGLFAYFLVGSLTASDGERRGDSRIVWHGNVTNSDRPADRVAALQWQNEFTAGTRWLLPGSNRARAGWHLRADLWPRFQGLDAISAGADLSLSRKLGLGSSVPVLAASVAGEEVFVRESARSGHSGKLTLQAQQRLGSAWQFVAGVEWEKYQARGLAFNRAGREYFLRAELQASPVWWLSAELRTRNGTVVSYTSPPRPDLVTAGKVLTLLDTFERAHPLLAYYFPAETISGAVELTRVLDPRTTAFLRFEYGDTTHNALRYLNQRTTLGLTRRF